jgi:hypothetical protein
VRELRLDDKEYVLLIGSLESDSIGKWGDDRHVRLIKLIAKVKRARASK